MLIPPLPESAFQNFTPRKAVKWNSKKFSLECKLVSVYISFRMHVFTCLAIDGGGIRGLYSAALLDCLMKRFAAKRQVSKLDVGKGFDLVAGTSTGGILACGLAYGCSPARLVELYRTYGPQIFSGQRMPSGGLARFLAWAWRHRASPIHNSNGCLRQSLVEIFGNETLASLYERRSIAVCIPSIRLLNESPRVFKTPHLGAEYRRDDAVGVVDVCMATSAAPVFLPLASIKDGRNGVPEPYVDGGLWMNNPTLIAMLEALALTQAEQEIVIVSVGTCPNHAGSVPRNVKLDAGLAAWKGGAKALELSMNAQAQANAEMTQRLAREFVKLNRKITVVRCHEGKLSSEHSAILSLDNANPEALDLLCSLAETDATETFRWVQEKTPRGSALETVFSKMPVSLHDN